jgi:hypothetical protein
MSSNYEPKGGAVRKLVGLVRPGMGAPLDKRLSNKFTDSGGSVNVFFMQAVQAEMTRGVIPVYALNPEEGDRIILKAIAVVNDKSFAQLGMRQKDVFDQANGWIGRHPSVVGANLKTVKSFFKLMAKVMYIYDTIPFLVSLETFLTTAESDQDDSALGTQIKDTRGLLNDFFADIKSDTISDALKTLGVDVPKTKVLFPNSPDIIGDIIAQVNPRKFPDSGISVEKITQLWSATFEKFSGLLVIVGPMIQLYDGWMGGASAEADGFKVNFPFDDYLISKAAEAGKAIKSIKSDRQAARKVLKSELDADRSQTDGSKRIQFAEYDSLTSSLISPYEEDPGYALCRLCNEGGVNFAVKIKTIREVEANMASQRETAPKGNLAKARESSVTLQGVREATWSQHLKPVWIGLLACDTTERVMDLMGREKCDQSYIDVIREQLTALDVVNNEIRYDIFCRIFTQDRIVKLFGGIRAPVARGLDIT